MKNLRYFFTFILTLALGVAMAQELPQPSPMAKLEQRVGLTDVTVKYSRPGTKNRKVWGELVPYNEVWRTGANASTIISFSDDVKINGRQLPKGEYALFTIPDQNEWTIIFNKNLTLWGADGYKQEEDALRFTVKPETNNHVESMLFAFDNLKNESADLMLMWEKVKITLNINVDVDAKAMENIKKSIADLDNAFRTYNASATYLLDANKDLKTALEYAQKSVSMKERFWNVYTLSKAYAANGMYKEAVATAEKSMKMAQEAKYEPYVKMNKENIDKWKKSK